VNIPVIRIAAREPARFPSTVGWFMRINQPTKHRHADLGQGIRSVAKGAFADPVSLARTCIRYASRIALSQLAPLMRMRIARDLPARLYAHKALSRTADT